MILINRIRSLHKLQGFYLNYKNRQYNLRFIHSDNMENAGYRRNKSEHRHSVYHIIVVKRGSGSFLIDKKIIKVVPGTCILISPGQLHSLGVDEEEVVTYGEVTFEFLDNEDNQLSLNFSSILSLISGLDVRIPSYAAISDFNALEVIDPYIQEIAELRLYQGNDSFFHISSSSILLRLLTALAKLFSELNRTFEEISPIKKVHSYIEKNYQLPITLQDLSHIGSLSEKYISRNFKELYGRTPIYFRDDLRIESACELLRGSNYAIGEIAGKCGFNDAYYFSKIFKKKTGYSPKDFRNRNSQVNYQL